MRPVVGPSRRPGGDSPTSSPLPVAVMLSVLAVLSVLLVGCGDSSFTVGSPSADEPADYSFEIPEGAGLALDRGEPLEIMPAELAVEVGEIIEIVNFDDRGHLVGPFFVEAGETLRHSFASTGEYAGTCTVHPSGEIVVRVT